MKCRKHSDQEAVGQCVQCGAGVCAECAELTKDFSINGLLCADCVKQLYIEGIDKNKKENKKLLTNSILSIILYIIGAILIIVSLTPWKGQDSFILICFGVLCCGVFSGISGWKTMKKTNEDFDNKYGEEYIVDENGIHKNNHIILNVILFLIGTVFGVIATPIRVIINFVDISSNKREINVMYRDLGVLESL